jgi:hypothetical protein
MNRHNLIALGGAAALLVAACTQDFDTFFEGNTLGAGGATASGTGAGGGVGGGVAGSGGTGGSGGCATPMDCPGADTTCESRTCVGNVCGVEQAPAGSVCAEGGGTLCDGVGNCVVCITDGDCAMAERCDNNACVPVTCTDSILNGDETDVDCGGSCNPCPNGDGCLVFGDCESKLCIGGGGGGGGAGGSGGGSGFGACTACSNDGECSPAPNTWCDTSNNGGTCTDQKMDGQSCNIANECLSNSCADGVCCDTACDQTCEACVLTKTGMADGTCAPVTGSTDPDSECVDQTAPSCGANGTGCSGTGAQCNLYVNTTPCAAAGCSAGQQSTASLCDGVGNCVPGSTTSCSPYVCGGSTCLTDCTSNGNADCATGFYCDGTNCQPTKMNGTGCNGPSECTSGNCVDGVCCDTGCGAACEACTAAKTGGSDGTCGFVTVSTDPDMECAGPDVCNGAGACQCGDSILNGQESDTDCGGGVCPSCGNGQTCNGGGDCSSGNCADGVCCDAVCGASCEACTAVKTGGTDGICGFVTVSTDPDMECAGPDVCNGAGSCQCNDSILNGQESDVDCGGGVCPNCTGGQICNGGGDCSSGNCVDGVCCDAACGGLCEACTAAKTGGTDGVCGFVTATTDPDTECTGADVCNGAGACQCSDGILNGLETALDCGGGVCPTCGNGDTCNLGTDCGSGNCADGVCCDAACGGLCQACTAAKTGGSDGVCGFVSGNTDPDAECPGLQVCDGAGMCGALSCGFDPPAPGGSCPVVCTGGCVGSTCIVACNGVNTCKGSTIDCPPNFECQVECNGDEACRDATIKCDSTYACNVECNCTGGGGSDKCCENAVIDCPSTGTCGLFCGPANNTCKNTDLNCGNNACTATCNSSNELPIVTCGSSCNCTTC